MVSLVRQVDAAGLRCHAGSDIAELEEAVHTASLDAVLLVHEAVGIGAQAVIARIGGLRLLTLLALERGALAQFDPALRAARRRRTRAMTGRGGRARADRHRARRLYRRREIHHLGAEFAQLLDGVFFAPEHPYTVLLIGANPEPDPAPSAAARPPPFAAKSPRPSTRSPAAASPTAGGRPWTSAPAPRRP